jgi:hypothetical protein
MRHQTIGALTAGAVLSAASFLAQPAAAVPVSNLASAAEQLSTTQNVAWVCGPFRCWWTPRYYYAPVVVAPRAYYGYPAYGYGYPAYGYGYRYPAYSYRVVRPGWGVVRPGWGYGVRRGYSRRW